jgi:hypothetical protein
MVVAVVVGEPGHAATPIDQPLAKSESRAQMRIIRKGLDSFEMHI